MDEGRCVDKIVIKSWGDKENKREWASEPVIMLSVVLSPLKVNHRVRSVTC